MYNNYMCKNKSPKNEIVTSPTNCTLYFVLKTNLFYVWSMVMLSTDVHELHVHC